MMNKVLYFYLVWMSIYITGCTAEDDRTDSLIESQYSPILISVIASPTPFKGSDGAMHYVYELKMQNVTPFSFMVKEVSIVNEKNGDIVHEYTKNEIENISWQFPQRIPTDTIGPQTTVFTFIEFSIPTGKMQPTSLCHEITIQLPSEIPHGFKAFIELDQSATEMTLASVCTSIDRQVIPTISPPLKGEGWVAADGCCTSTRHVRAFLPINNEWVNAQRFAIDWEKIDDDDYIYTGDSLQLDNYSCYGEPVHAVANGEVVKVLTGLPDQIPGKLPDVIPLSQADGNHIVQHIGSGLYALYAHLKPGSVTVAEGDILTQGMKIGEVGNSGNSQAPHLHFHITEGPSSLGSNGIPYTFDEFTLHGFSVSTEAFDDAELKGVPLDINYQTDALIKNALSLDQAIVTFR